MAIQKKAAAPAPQVANANPAHQAGGGVASFNPASFQQGGLLDDVDVVFSDCAFVEYDYGGQADKPALCLKAHLTTPDGEEVDQYWSAGDTKRAQPSEDGSTIVLMPGVRGLNNKTNAALFFQSLLDQGFPPDKMDAGNVFVLNGLNAHVNRVAQPKRTGLARKETEREPTVLVITKINAMPWDKKSAGAKGIPTASSAAPAKAQPPTSIASNGDDPTDRAAEVLLTILGESGGTVRKAQIALKAFKYVKGDASKAEVLEMLKDDDFLSGGEELGWQFDPEQQTVTAL